MADWLEGYRAKKEKALTTTAAPSAGARTDLVGLQLGAPSSTTPAAAEKTDPASTYIDNLTKTLSGNDPTVKNARQTASTQNAVGDYLAKRQAKQESLNAGYTPGTLQSQRTADRYQATANEASLQRDNQVNEMQRDRSDTAMSQANQLRLEERSDIETLINSIEDPVTQAAARRIQAAGGDVRGYIAGTTTGGTGTGSAGTGTTETGAAASGTPVDEFGRPRSLTPAETNLKNAQDEARVYGLTEGTPEFDEYVRQRTIGASEGQVAPITAEEKARQKQERLDAALTDGLQGLSDEDYTAFLADIPATIASAIPTTKAAIEAAKNDPATRGIVKIGDEAYQIQDYYQQNVTRNTGAKSNRHADYAVATDRDGNTVYINDDGDVFTYKPPGPSERGRGAKYDSERGVWIETYANSGGPTGKVYDPATEKWVKG